MRHLIPITALLMSPVMVGAQSLTIEGAIERITNGDVEWEGNWVGLNPRLRGEAAELLFKNPKASRKRLIEALQDPNRFVVAHVLLGLSDKGNYKFSATHWRGLQVSLRNDGSAEILPSQRHALYKYWKGRYGGA